MTRLALPSHLLLLTSFVAATCVYMFFLEPWGHDTWFHITRLQDIAQQLGRGQFPSHFAENVAQDKGLPVWIYYSQWVYWPAMLLGSLGASPLVALKLIYCVSLVVCCVGCYRLLRTETDPDAAAFGTLLFLTSNYVIGEILQRSAYAEFLSVALLPLLLVSMHRSLLRENKGSAMALVLLSSLMILFHPLSFMNAAYAVIAYAGYTAIRWRVPFPKLLRLIPLFSLALGLTAFYWLPAVIETKYVLGAEGVPTPLNQTFLTIWRYLNFSGPTNLGFVLTLLAPLVAGSLLLRHQVPDVPGMRSSWPLLAGILVCVFLTLRLSESLYNAFPLLAANLWVWRVLFPLILLVVIFVNSNLRALPQQLRSDIALAGLAGLAILQSVVFVLWNTATYLSARPVDIKEIEEALAVGSTRTEGFGIDEYLPHPRMFPIPAEECRVVRSLLPEGRYEMSFEIASRDADACIHIPRYWNTRYVASIDGDPSPVYANEEGEILIVPRGRAGVVTLRFARPGYVTFSAFLSGAAAVLLLIGVARAIVARR
jgi:hypothetical protein